MLIWQYDYDDDMNIQNKSSKNLLEFKSIDYQLQHYIYPDLIREKGPQVFRSGSGVKVQDIDGNSYIEGMSGLWSASLGFNENELVEAAIAFCPPLIISKEEINQMFDKIESVFPEMDQIAKGHNW